MTQPHQFMQQAIELALHNVTSGNGGPFGAVIVRNGLVIAAAANQVTSRCDPTAHAEVIAIRQACKVIGDFQLLDCELYTSCEPCPMCLGAIYWARIQKVYYACGRMDAANAGFDDGFIYDEMSVAPALRKIPMLPLNFVDAMLPFTAWNASKQKVCY